MARSTGPVLAAGAITWTNSYLLADQPEPLFDATFKVGLATGIAAGLLSILERVVPDLAAILGWAMVVTVLFVRVPPDSRNPTPLERAFNL